MTKDKKCTLPLEDTATWHRLFKLATERETKIPLEVRGQVQIQKNFEVVDILFDAYQEFRDDLLLDKLGAREVPLIDRVIIHNLLSRVLDESYFGNEPNERQRLFHALFPELPEYVHTRDSFFKGTTLAEKLRAYKDLAPHIE